MTHAQLPRSTAPSLREELSALPDPLALLEGLFAHSPVPYAVFCAQGRCVLVNPAYRAMFGSAPPPDYNLHSDEVLRHLGLGAHVPRVLAGETLQVPAFWYDPAQLQHVQGAEARCVAIACTVFPLGAAGGGAASHLAVAYQDVTAQLQAQAAVESERDLLRAIVAQSSEGIIVADAQGVLRIFNPAAERQHGASAQEVAAPEWVSTFHLRDLQGRPLPLEETALYRAVRGETVSRVQWQVQHPDGELRTLEGTATPLRRADGSAAGGVLVTRDVTEEVEARRQADALAEELRQSEAHYRATVELSPQVPWTATPGGAISSFSERWLQLTGMSRAAALGEGWVNAAHDEDRPRMVQAWTHSVRTGDPYDVEHRIRLASGGYRWMRSRAFPRRDATGRIVHWYGTTEDIHDRKEVQAALEESERLLREWVENLPDLAWSAQPDGHIDYFNRRWYEYTGTTPEQMRDGGWRAAQHPDELPRVSAAWQAALASGQPAELQFPLRGADGVYRHFLTRVRPLRDGQGQVVRWFGTNTNIDEQQRQAHALREALEARNTFLSIASHELKTPLTPLTLKLQALERSRSRSGAAPGSPVPVDPRDLDVMRRQVKRLGDLVNDLLDVSRIRTGQLRLERQPTDFAALVREVATRFEPEAERAGCRLSVHAPAALQGMLDPLRLEQVVGNLLSNALKYGAGRPVSLEVEAEGGWGRLQVRDQGIGIAAEDAARIFERFERAVSERHYGGFGLGLYVTREIVEGLGGRVHVASAPGQGACFSVELPLAP